MSREVATDVVVGAVEHRVNVVASGWLIKSPARTRGLPDSASAPATPLKLGGNLVCLVPQ